MGSGLARHARAPERQALQATRTPKSWLLVAAKHDSAFGGQMLSSGRAFRFLILVAIMPRAGGVSRARPGIDFLPVIIDESRLPTAAAANFCRRGASVPGSSTRLDVRYIRRDSP
jgi:hypothetical protein